METKFLKRVGKECMHASKLAAIKRFSELTNGKTDNCEVSLAVANFTDKSDMIWYTICEQKFLFLPVFKKTNFHAPEDLEDISSISIIDAASYFVRAGKLYCYATDGRIMAAPVIWHSAQTEIYAKLAGITPDSYALVKLYTIDRVRKFVGVAWVLTDEEQGVIVDIPVFAEDASLFIGPNDEELSLYDYDYVEALENEVFHHGKDIWVTRLDEDDNIYLEKSKMFMSYNPDAN